MRSALTQLSGLHSAGDLDQLRQRVAAERHALQRDRWRAVLLVAEEELEGMRPPGVWAARHASSMSGWAATAAAGWKL